MSILNTDRARFWNTCADGNRVQLDQSASLGGFRSTTPAIDTGVLLVSGQPNFIVQRVMPNVTPTEEITPAITEPYGEMEIETSDNRVRVKFVGDNDFTDWEEWPVDGSELSIGDGGTKGIRLREHAGVAARGLSRWRVVPVYNSVFAMDDCNQADTATGKVTYRAVMIQAAEVVTFDFGNFGGFPLGTQPTDVVQLPSSGAGTIETSGSFAGWPESGHAHIRSSAPATVEVVYYSSRTDTVLTVPASGRAQMDTTATATPSNGDIYWIYSFRYALESPVDGAIQTIADEETAPTSVTFGFTQFDALVAGEEVGLWIERTIAPGSHANSVQSNGFFWTSGTDPVMLVITDQRYRIANADADRYEIWYAFDADVDLDDPPDDIYSTMPQTIPMTIPGSGTKTVNVVLRKRNEFGVISQNDWRFSLTIDDNGNVIGDISTPTGITLQPIDSGRMRISGIYSYALDDDPADVFVVEYNAGGATDTEVTFPMIPAPLYRPWKVLSGILPAVPKGATIEAVVSARRTGDSAQSAPSAPVYETVTTLPLAAPNGRGVFGGTAHQYIHAGNAPSGTVVIDAGDNIYLNYAAGVLELWNDSELVFRILMDSRDFGNNGLWTTYAFQQEAISGAGTGPAEVDGDDIYLVVSGIRRVQIDTDSKIIKATAMIQGDPDPSFRATGAITELVDWLTLNTYDGAVKTNESTALIDSDGVLYLAVPWRQVATVGDIP